MYRLLAVAVSVSVLATAAFAANVPAATQSFIDKAAVTNKYEIDTSELALKYGKSPDVKSFAQQMITDHQKVGEDFKAALADAKIEPPADSLDIAHAAKYAKLRLFTTEAGFDSAYVDAQLQAHEDAVATFKDYAANGPTPPIKSFASKTLPTLEHHLEMAKSLHAKTLAKH
jgi:putative membrane protein